MNLLMFGSALCGIAVILGIAIGVLIQHTNREE